MREHVLDTLANEGVLLGPSAAEFVLSMSRPLEFVHTALSHMPQQPLVLTLGDLATAVEVSMHVDGVEVPYTVDDTTSEEWRRRLR